jgi:zinc transporter ZupT
MHLPSINVNIIVIASLLIAALYGMLAGKQRLRVLILSVYVGVVLAEQLLDVVAPYAHGFGKDEISWMLLLLPVVIFGFFGVSHGKHERGHAVANIIVGFLAGALIISSGLRLLPTSEMSNIDSQSFIAMELQQLHLWILGLLPIVALILGFMKGEKHHG